MPRPLTGELSIAAQAQQSEFVHLLEFEFSSGSLLMSSGAQDLVIYPYAVRIGSGATRYLIRNPVLAPWPTNALTIEGWAKLDSGQLSLNHFLFSYAVGSGAELSSMQLRLATVAGPNLRLQGTINNVDLQDADNYTTDGAWHHLAFTWQSSDGAAKLYIDGILAHSGTIATGYSATAGGSACIGVSQSGVGSGFANPFIGELDEMRVYRRVLSALEISEHFNRRFANEQKLVGLWTFDKFSSTASNLGLDTGPIGNHMTVNGITDPTPGDGIKKTWTAVGGLLRFPGIEEGGDIRGQGVDIQLSGVTQTAIAALMGGTTYRGRRVRIWRAHFDAATGLVVASPLLLIDGLQLSPYEIREERDSREGGTVVVRTRVKGRMGVDRIKGIWSNVISHQHVFPGDTFFQHTASLQNSKVYWGTNAPTSVGQFTDPRQRR